MLKNCREILAYTDDVLDGKASEQVREMFFTHLDTCEMCKNKFEISKQIATLLKDEHIVLGEEFTNAVMSRIRSVNMQVKEKKPASYWLKPLFAALSCVVVLFIVIVGVVSIQNHMPGTEEAELLSVSAGPQLISDTDGTAFVQDHFLKQLNVSLTDPVTMENVLSLLKSAGYTFASTDYSYITFVRLHTLNDMNGNAKIAYIPGYNNGKVYFYKTSLTQSELEWALSGSTKEIYTINGVQTAQEALVLAVTEG